MITPIDSIKVRSQAFTKLTTITVVADEIEPGKLPEPRSQSIKPVLSHGSHDSTHTLSCDLLDPFAHHRIPNKKIPNPPKM